MKLCLITAVLVFNCAFHIKDVKCEFADFINTISGYFGYNKASTSGENDDFSLRVPYEVSTVDEKFISEASKLTGVALSELDSCQQRVVLKLQIDCDKMNDEQLAKMAVHLLNCQSYVEGRRIYPCSDEMSIKQCTSDMDSDTWTSYHLMSNRARAVCYSIRQVQFRGMAEHTVNRLMDAARDQLGTLKKIANDQKDIKEIAETTHDVLFKGQNQLIDQQKDLQRAQFHGQLTLEDNIMKLVDEKKLITESHGELIKMTKDLQDKLESSAKEIETQTGYSKIHHEELMEDLITIHSKANAIFQKIEESSKLLMHQNEDLKRQYQSTLKNLEEVNKTVHSLVSLVGGTHQALEEHLTWVSTALGGTDLAVERIYLILWHVAFILVAMIGCAFLNASYSTRLVVATLPPLNLSLALYQEKSHLDVFGLTAAITLFIIAQTIILWAINLYKKPAQAISWNKEKLTPTRANSSPIATSRLSKSFATIDETEENDSSSVTAAENFDFVYRHTNYDHEVDCHEPAISSPTPPLSRNGFYSPKSRSRSNTPSVKLNGSLKASCAAKTRLGTPCKLSVLPGRDYCYRHQTGDSVIG